jgi:signal transduction histidine kinase
VVANESRNELIEVILRPVVGGDHIRPAELELSETIGAAQNDTLVRVNAIVLSQKRNSNGEIFELGEGRRILTATLEGEPEALPQIAPGSRVNVIGVCEYGAPTSSMAVSGGVEKGGAGLLNLSLRSPADILVLSGPPWWTLKRAVELVGTLLTILAVTLLWVYLLRRRLLHQHVARLAFSRQILQGQESERQRIAVNLHDSLGQNLLVIKNQAQLALQPTVDDNDRQLRLNKISELTSQALEEVRQITRDLRPYQLDRLGLTQAIRAVVTQVA